MEERNKPGGTVPYANGHVHSPRNDPHTIKSDAIYPMELSPEDVDALARFVPSTRTHIALFHVPHSKGRVPETTYNNYCDRTVVKNEDGGCVNLGIYTHQLGRVVSEVKKKLKRIGSRREEGRGEETRRKG